MKTPLLLLGCFLSLLPSPAWSQGAAAAIPADQAVNRDLVKIAAVQISGYDKGDGPREGYDAADELLPYIERAGRDGAQLVVFP